MAQKHKSMNRVHDRRLWDSDGRVWMLRDRYDADPDEVSALVRSSAQVAVHGFGRPMRWVAGRDIATIYAHALRHQEEPDEDGLTYAACIWTAEGRRLLTFETYC